MKKRNLSLMRKRGLMGYAYCAPWILGFLLFFLTPVVKTAIYSFNTFDKVTLDATFVGQMCIRDSAHPVQCGVYHLAHRL